MSATIHRTPGPKIKALPLWQPWATLVAIGAKRVETRAYPPARRGLLYGQRIAIRADTEHFREHVPDPATLPLGALIATCTLVRASEITQASAQELLARNPSEHAFGDYTPGRWAWVLADVTPLFTPIPFIGSQGVFDVPADLVGEKPAQGVLDVA